MQNKAYTQVSNESKRIFVFVFNTIMKFIEQNVRSSEKIEWEVIVFE